MTTAEGERNYEEKKYICCWNGTFDINKKELLAHNSEYKLINQYKANYREIPECEFQNSQFKRFLDSILDYESQLTLQEVFELLLSPHASEVQRAVILLGEGKNGKSTLVEIMQALIGSQNNICSIGLSHFGKEFDISQVEGKIANLVLDDDLTGEKISGIFKSMVCGESVRVNRKNKDIITMAFNITHIFNLNRLPSAADKSDGFYRRFCIIVFKNTFGSKEEVEGGKAMYERDFFGKKNY